MQLQVRLFARAKDLAGTESIAVELPDSATVSDLRAALESQHPSLAPVIPSLHVAIGTDYAADTVAIDASSDVSCFPPVSGG